MMKLKSLSFTLPLRRNRTPGNEAGRQGEEQEEIGVIKKAARRAYVDHMRNLPLIRFATWVRSFWKKRVKEQNK